MEIVSYDQRLARISSVKDLAREISDAERCVKKMSFRALEAKAVHEKIEWGKKVRAAKDVVHALRLHFPQSKCSNGN
jgi:hypothetical protein